MRRIRVALFPLLLLAVVGSLTGLVLDSPAEARHNFSMLAVQPQQAKAGDEVTVSGFSYTKTAVVRFGSLDGPELARLEPTSNNDIGGTVRIPPETPPGRYILFAMHQNEQGKPTRFPGRAAVVVSGPGGPPLGVETDLKVEPRPQGVLEGESVSTGNLFLAAIATVGVASLLVGIVVVITAARRRRMTDGVSA